MLDQDCAVLIDGVGQAGINPFAFNSSNPTPSRKPRPPNTCTLRAVPVFQFVCLKISELSVSV